MSKNIPALFIRSKHQPYRRAGFSFSRQGVGIALAALTDDQVQVLKNDPRLDVEECTFPAEEAVEAPTTTDPAKPHQVILVGSDTLPASFKFGELEAVLGDIVAIAFSASGKTEAEWNDPVFESERDAQLHDAVAGLTENPEIFQAYLDERLKSTQPKAAAPKAAKQPKAVSKTAKPTKQAKAAK